MTGSCEAVIFSFGVAALLSYIFTASHNTQITEQPQQWKKVLPLAGYCCFPRHYHIHIFGNRNDCERLVICYRQSHSASLSTLQFKGRS